MIHSVRTRAHDRSMECLVLLFRLAPWFVGMIPLVLSMGLYQKAGPGGEITSSSSSSPLHWIRI